jgi:hypothetical protein
MPTLLVTLAIAFIVIVVAILLLGIGWLLTGKSKIRGTCGQNPTKMRNEVDHCGTDSYCQVCKKPEDKKK